MSFFAIQLLGRGHSPPCFHVATPLPPSLSLSLSLSLSTPYIPPFLSLPLSLSSIPPAIQLWGLVIGTQNQRATTLICISLSLLSFSPILFSPSLHLYLWLSFFLFIQLLSLLLLVLLFILPFISKAQIQYFMARDKYILIRINKHMK